MLDFTKFIPLQKVVHKDDGTVEVWGRAAVEEVDKARPPEVMDYLTSKPYFQKWSDSFQKATQTAGVEPSLGNVRVMHNPMSAVGKLIHFEPMDSEKAIDVGVLVVDPTEAEKVRKGVYTGFSVGGRYANRWYDSKLSATRYTAAPVELSLVDAPCIPSATFSMVKVDGATELMKFDPNVERAGNSILLGAVDVTTEKTPQYIHVDRVDVMSVGVPIDFGKVMPQSPVAAPVAIVGQPARSDPMAGQNVGTPGVVPLQAIPNQTPANTDILKSGKPEDVPEGSKIVEAHAKATPVDDLAAPAMKPTPPPQQQDLKASPKQAADLKAGAEEPSKESAPEDKDVVAAKSDLGYELAKKFIHYGQHYVGIAWKGRASRLEKSYSRDPQKYGDPANFAWQCNTPEQRREALLFYNAGLGKADYSPREWNILGRRLARLLSKVEGKVNFDEKSKALLREI